MEIDFNPTNILKKFIFPTKTGIACRFEQAKIFKKIHKGKKQRDFINAIFAGVTLYDEE